MSKSHIGSNLILKNTIHGVDENTSFLAHYDYSPNDINGIKPYGPHIDDNTILYFDMGELIEKSHGTYVKDKSKYGNFGKVNGATLCNGRKGKALEFGNNNVYVQPLLDPSKLDSSSLTIEAWVYPYNNNTSWMILGKQEPNQRIYIGSNANGIWDFGIDTSDWDNPPSDGTKPSVDVNQWQHIVLTLDNGTAKLYKDGEYAFSKTYTVFTSSLMLALGANNSNGSIAYEFPGRIDKVIILNRVLTDSEIKQRYNEAIYSLTGIGFGKYGGAIAVEEETENILKDVTLAPGGTAPYSWCSIHDQITVTTGFEDVFGGNNAVLYEGGPDQGNGQCTMRYGSINGEQNDIAYGKTYTFSLYIKLVPGKNKPSSVTLDIVDRGVTDVANQLSYQWKRFETTVTHDNNTNYSFVDISFSNDSAIMVCCPQVEEKSYGTSFIIGAREKGKLYYPRELINLNSFTISCWFKVTHKYYSKNEYTQGISDNWYQPIIELAPTSNRGADIGLSVVITPAANYSVLSKIHLRSPRGSYGSTTIQDDTWYHMAVTFDGSEYKVYLNGVNECGLVSSTPPSVYDDSVLMVGGGYHGASNIFIDELRIDTVARTKEEILSWYLSSNPFFPQGNERVAL